jgi:hypothetical protein
MSLSVLLYALMASTLVALVGLLVVDAVRGVSGRRPAPPDARREVCSARRHRPARSVTRSALLRTREHSVHVGFTSW